jgi:hypothetical protein
MENINKLIARLKDHAEAWEVKGTDNRNELIGEQVMAFDCLTAANVLGKMGSVYFYDNLDRQRAFNDKVIDLLGQCVEDEISELETLEKLVKFWKARK